jgi:hypothetical protein
VREQIAVARLNNASLVADSTALEEKIVSLIRGNRSRKEPKEQWEQWAVELFALTYALSTIASDYELSKRQVKFAQEMVGREISDLRARQLEIPRGKIKGPRSSER